MVRLVGHLSSIPRKPPVLRRLPCGLVELTIVGELKRGGGGGGLLITTEICEDCCGCSWNTNDLRGARIVSDASCWSFCVVPSNNAAECTERQTVISEDYLEGVVDGST